MYNIVTKRSYRASEIAAVLDVMNVAFHSVIALLFAFNNMFYYIFHLVDIRKEKCLRKTKDAYTLILSI